MSVPLEDKLDRQESGVEWNSDTLLSLFCSWTVVAELGGLTAQGVETYGGFQILSIALWSG
jgi:hypothetical protein